MMGIRLTSTADHPRTLSSPLRYCHSDRRARTAFQENLSTRNYYYHHDHYHVSTRRMGSAASQNRAQRNQDGWPDVFKIMRRSEAILGWGMRCGVATVDTSGLPNRA